ncbi:MAG: glycosyltransferase family 39 protein [Phototrophicaceae bacterium]|jgi:hypothetical protein
MPVKSRRVPPILIVWLWVFTLLGAYHLTIDPLWFDEVFAFPLVGWAPYTPMSWGAIWNNALPDLVNPPGYYWLLNGWGRMVGAGAFQGRLLSLLAGCLAVATAYRVGRDSSVRAGLAAAVVLGSSAFFGIYTHELRMYTLVVLLALAAGWGYWRWMQRPAQWGRLFVLLALILALFYTHYTGAFWVAGLCVAHLIYARRDATWWRFGVGVGLCALLFLPWVLPVVRMYAAGGKDENGFPVMTMSLWSLVSNSIQAIHPAAAVLTVLALASAVWRAGRFARYWMLIIAVALLVTKGFDLFFPVLWNLRYILYLWGGLAVLVGIGLDRLAGRWLYPLLVVWAGFGVFGWLDVDYRVNINGPGAYAAWDASAQALAGRAQAGDRVALHLPQYTIYRPYHEPVANYYFWGLPVSTVAIESLRVQPDTDYLRAGLARVEGATRLWYARDLREIPEREGVFRRALDETLLACGEIQQGVSESLQMTLYIAPQPDANALTWDTADIRYLPLFDLNAPRGTLWDVTGVWWVGESVAPYTYSVALHLLDETGALVRQADYGLPTAGTHCGFGSLDMAGLPSGRYRLSLTVYAWESGQRLTINGQDNLILGAWNVDPS